MNDAWECPYCERGLDISAAVAERCAPLVEALSDIQEIAENPTMGGRYARINIISEARAALAAHRAARGDGRGT